MTIRIVTDFRVLMQLAKLVGQAKKSGDREAIAKAEKEHDEYRDLCLRSDRVNLGVSYGDL